MIKISRISIIFYFKLILQVFASFLAISGCGEMENENENIDVGIEVHPIPDIVLYETFGSINIDLDTIFSDQLGNPLSFIAISTDTLEVFINESIITITLAEPLILSEQISITANNGRGQIASDEFIITTEPLLEYRILGVWLRYMKTSPTGLTSVAQIEFFEIGRFILTDLTNPGWTYEGDYYVNNETWEYSWDLGPDGTVTLLDNNFFQMRFNDVLWDRKE